MSLVLYGITAYEYWRSSQLRDTPEFGAISVPSASTLCSRVPLRDLTGPLSRTEGLPGKLHLLVGGASERSTSEFVQFHCSQNLSKLPPGSFYQIGPSIYVASPELCFVQLASELPFLELVRAGFDLCSRYQLSPYERMQTTECEPSATRASISRFLAQMPKGFYGLGKARTAARWILENSRSPRETSLAMMLHLPSQIGGFQISNMELNRRIDPSDTARLLTRKSSFEADVYFPGQHRVLEYESDLCHSNYVQGSHDYEKISALQAMGYEVTPITTWQMNTFESLEALVVDAKRAMHLRDRRSDQLSAQRREMHYLVLSDERTLRDQAPLADTARWQFLLPRL